MRIDQIIPVALVVQMAAGGIVCLVCRRWLDGIYWIAGALLNVTIILRGL